MKNINWTQSFITAVITIGVTVIAGMILYYLQFNSPKLIYSYNKILPFESDSSNYSIYHFVVENKGSDVAEDVVSEIHVKPAIIKDFSINSDSPLEIDKKLLDDKLVLKVPSLNPKESFKISLWAISKSEFPEESVIKLRAKGIVGEKLEEEAQINSSSKYFKYLLMISVFVTALSLITRGALKAKNFAEKVSDDQKHSDDQSKVIAYVLGVHGLNEEVERLLSLPQGSSYWSEIDRLTSLAINSNDEELTKKTKLILEDLLSYAQMADKTKGIAFYNLARIDKKVGEEDNVIKHLAEAKKYIPGLLDTRTKIDPLFNVQKKAIDKNNTEPEKIF